MLPVTPRAVVFDVYNTLLEIGAPPAATGPRWRRLVHRLAGAPPALTHGGFLLATERVVARHHAAARAAGIPWPEVAWPAVVTEAFPQLAALAPAALDEFVLAEVRLRRTVRLAPGAARCLRRLRDRHVLSGLASNAQAYTLRELAAALRAARLPLALFEPGLRFWSFEHGFSKPDPHAFRILSTRLLARGISPPEILMVGDRPDNDLLPALAHGWQAWHLTTSPGPVTAPLPAGPFPALLAALDRA